uniref:PAS domain-containing protein n=1 Tax=Octactis speculum TaxID=3111310 RepID=A0A7S2D3Z7_9STRA|mmetsp:Transcript_43174/g.58995  ORF Transcript_43174/g.58995 Transcript_43174/m.58995 type:complete len:215 (+) Transcript_43174:56-700(+)
MMVKDDLIMCRVVMSTTNAIAKGAVVECSLEGMLKVFFTEDNTQLRSVELVFDVMNFMQQLSQACGGSFEVIPNSVGMLSKESDEARVVISALQPFRIEHVNQSWMNLCGFSHKEVYGQPLRAIHQGIETDNEKITELMNTMHRKLSHSILTVNYKKSGQPFMNFVRVFPLCTGPDVTHFLYVAEEQHSNLMQQQQQCHPHPEYRGRGTKTAVL